MPAAARDVDRSGDLGGWIARAVHWCRSIFRGLVAPLLRHGWCASLHAPANATVCAGGRVGGSPLPTIRGQDRQALAVP